MNQRRNQILFLAVVAAILVLVWLFHWRPVPPTAAPAQTEAQADSSAPIEQPARQSQPVAKFKPATMASTAPSNQSSPVEDPRQREMTETKMLWRTPIIFFGRVLDESNQPVAGVHVSYGANSANEQLSQEVRNEGETTSDARGMFKIGGIRGRSFVLELSHPAYYASSSNPPGFDYAGELNSGNGVPDTEDKAMVFYMHHKGNPTTLIERRGGLHKSSDGTTMEFPLRGKTRAEIIGQLQVQGWKGEPDSQNGHFDWKVKITMPSGGVLESTNEFAFVAPETGYQQTLEISESKDDPNWKASADKALFFKLPNCFARGQANIDLFHDLYFSMQYFVNPDGSANLENDPSQPFQEP
jgi:hypothetical protein